LNYNNSQSPQTFTNTSFQCKIIERKNSYITTKVNSVQNVTALLQILPVMVPAFIAYFPSAAKIL